VGRNFGVCDETNGSREPGALMGLGNAEVRPTVAARDPVIRASRRREASAFVVNVGRLPEPSSTTTALSFPVL